MRKYAAIIGCACIMCACDKHDPVLPGTRTAVFDMGRIDVLGDTVPNLPDNLATPEIEPCPYRQDSSNVIWDGERKVFSGFSTSNFVRSTQTPVCSGKFVYAGLTTGELVKINPKTRQISWIADIYRPSNMTGGASIVDIIAPLQIRGNDVYAGGLGDAFCRLNATSGAKKWCANIGTAMPFILTDGAAFVVGTDNNLYALRLADGAIYWRTELRTQAMPVYADKTITVASEKINAETGKIIK